MDEDAFDLNAFDEDAFDFLGSTTAAGDARTGVISSGIGIGIGLSIALALLPHGINVTGLLFGR